MDMKLEPTNVPTAMWQSNRVVRADNQQKKQNNAKFKTGKRKERDKCDRTMCTRKASVESLSVDFDNIIWCSAMEQLPFVVLSSIIFVHFLFSHYVRLVQMGVLYTLDSCDVNVSSCGLNLSLHSLVFRGTQY